MPWTSGHWTCLWMEWALGARIKGWSVVVLCYLVLCWRCLCLCLLWRLVSRVFCSTLFSPMHVFSRVFSGALFLQWIGELVDVAR